jgi:multidrug resistance efflux pump
MNARLSSKARIEKSTYHMQELKAKMNRMRQAEHERLKQLSLYSGEAIKELERKLEQAERILKLAEINRKVRGALE